MTPDDLAAIEALAAAATPGPWISGGFGPSDTWVRITQCEGWPGTPVCEVGHNVANRNADAAFIAAARTAVPALLAHIAALSAERDAALSRATAAEARGAEVRAPIYARIEAERASQDAKRGEPNYPDVDRVLTDRKGSTRIDGAGVHRWPDGCDPERMAEEYGIPAEWRAKANCNGAAKLGQCTWAHIAVEEMAEAVHAATLAQQGRGPEEDVDAELVQLAAVVTAWIEARARRLDALAAKGGVR